MELLQDFPNGNVRIRGTEIEIKRIEKILKSKNGNEWLKNKDFLIQGKPFYFFEMLERRSINRNVKGRGKIGTLLITNCLSKEAMKNIIPCSRCNLFILNENLTKKRYVKEKPYCLSCIVKGL